MLAFPGVPKKWRIPDLEAPLSPIIPVSFAKGAYLFDFFSAVTTLGTPQDVTLQELRIECFFPMNEATEANARRLLDGNGARPPRRLEATPAGVDRV